MKAPAVPIEKAPFHQPVFWNELVTVLKIDVPPRRNTRFHTHTADSVSINIEAADMANTLPGQLQTPPQRSRRGQANFTAYSKQPPRTHKASNMGETPFHNISFMFNDPQPGRFQPSTRSGPYTEIMDNERVRGWRLVGGGKIAPPTHPVSGDLAALRVCLPRTAIFGKITPPGRGQNWGISLGQSSSGVGPEVWGD
jgi:hypothetical protein